MNTPYDLVKQHYRFYDLFDNEMEDREYQTNTVNELAPLSRAGFYLDVGCVDSDTEYLSPTGWVKISEYAGGKVGQYNLDGTVDFVTPTEYVKLPCSEMIRFKTKYGVDQLLSPEHRVLYRSEPGKKLKVKRADEIESAHIKNVTGWRGGKFPTTFRPKISTCLAITNEQLRVQVAVMADGHFPNGTTRVQVRLKKDRKQRRLAQLLYDANIPFRVEGETWEGCEGFVRFTFHAPWRVKEFDERFWEASLEQLAVIADEVVYWDGSPRKGGEFYTGLKKSADFIQYVFTSQGKRSRIQHQRREREGYKISDEYYVNAVQGDSHTGLSGNSGGTKTESVWREPSTDGFKYCFMVPSTFLVFRRNGCIFASGNTGKTLSSTVAALYKKLIGEIDTVIVTMPPILISGWANFLRRIKPPVSVVPYVGSPKVRKALDLNADFILMSNDIFKRDFDLILERVGNRRIHLMVDEATSIKNIESQNHKAMKCLVEEYGATIALLTGTPLSTPLDGYAYIRTLAPGVYRNFNQFQNIHVAKRDLFNNPTEWANLELLADNMKINAVRLLRREIRSGLKPVQYSPIIYELAPEHYKLYTKLINEELLELESGGKIDATQESALYHASQQLVTNWGHFAERPELVGAGYDVIQEVLDELGEGKLIVYSNYRMTNRSLVQHFSKSTKVLAMFGDVPQAQQNRTKQEFIDNPEARLMVAQPSSAGVGVDGWQHVCSDVLFFELPRVPKDFHQAVGRVDRDGQKNVVNVRLAVANKTVQVKLMNQVLSKDEVIGKVMPNVKDLRKALFGE